jgi:hypothetical protein
VEKRVLLPMREYSWGLCWGGAKVNRGNTIGREKMLLLNAEREVTRSFSINMIYSMQKGVVEIGRQ